MKFRKAHGTGNDFVILPDVSGDLRLTSELVARICDRHFGLGADGVLRIVRTDAAGEQVPDSEGCEFFMDYRNADGSLAQMCGNGARVFADYLWQTELAPAGPLRFATRGGARLANKLAGGAIRIDMGPAVIGAADSVRVTANGSTWKATPVHLPNPHAVVMLDDLTGAGPLLEPPLLDPPSAYPDGANVEFVLVRGPDHIAMRVHERGVGETLSCGTGACAAAVAYAAGRFGRVRVEVPGGLVVVDLSEDGTVALTGPVETVATGELEAQWLERT
jgi:diaminopimelate epimerase